VRHGQICSNVKFWWACASVQLEGRAGNSQEFGFCQKFFHFLLSCSCEQTALRGEKGIKSTQLEANIHMFIPFDIFLFLILLQVVCQLPALSYQATALSFGHKSGVLLVAYSDHSVSYISNQIK
jgi:hypothetical protein